MFVHVGRSLFRLLCCTNLVQEILTYILTYLHIYLLTYLLTPGSRVLFEKLTVSQLVKKLPVFYGTRMFITAFTSVRHLSLSQVSATCHCPEPDTISKMSKATSTRETVRNVLNNNDKLRDFFSYIFVYSFSFAAPPEDTEWDTTHVKAARWLTLKCKAVFCLRNVSNQLRTIRCHNYTITVLMSALFPENARLSLHRYVKINMGGNWKHLYNLRMKQIYVLKAEILWRLSKQLETRVKCSAVFFLTEEI
jgi:hypothetical protein